MKTLIEYIVKNIVDNPDKIVINEKLEENVIFFELYANSADISKIIGRNGQTVKALRSILNASATKMKKKVMLEVKELPSSDNVQSLE